MATTLSLRRLWTIYQRTAVSRGLSKRDLASIHLAFYSGAREVLKVLTYLIERGNYEELAFDVVYADGQHLTGEPLEFRRARLPALVSTDAVVRLSQDLPGSTADIVEALRASGIEGVIAKRRDSTYQPGERSNDWVKLKLERQQEFVIGGYRPDGANGLDALLVGYYEGKALQFAGKVRACLVP